MPNGFVPALESARGIAAVCVCAFHVLAPIRLDGNLVFNQTIWTTHNAIALIFRLATVIFNGAAAVSVFFVLSGFVLALALDRLQGSPFSISLEFCSRRALRIYPAMFVNVLLMAVVLGSLTHVPGFFPSWHTISVAWPEISANLLLTNPCINGATWTLAIELEAIPFLLLGHFAFRRYGLPAMFLMTALAATGLLGAHTNGLHEYLFMFYLGMLIARLGQARERKIARPVCAITASLAALISARFFFEYDSKIALLIEGMSSAYLVLALAYGQRCCIHSVLEMKPLKLIGRHSYSIYLYHPLIMPLVGFGVVYRYLPSSDAITAPVLIITSVALTIPFAWLSYNTVEVPGTRLLQTAPRGALQWIGRLWPPHRSASLPGAHSA